MPKIGLTMTEGKIVEWKKKEGDWVEKGDILFVFETEKVTFEVEASESGFLAKILAQVDETIPVGTVVGILIEKKGEKIEILTEKPKAVIEKIEERAKEILVTWPIGIRATPLARKMAKEHRLDLKKIPGSDPGGRIRRMDVERILQSKVHEPLLVQNVEETKLVKFTGMRRIIAQKMLAAKIETAQAYMGNTIDATKILEARERLIPVIEKNGGSWLSPSLIFS